jgi:hypothetical protein
MTRTSIAKRGGPGRPSRAPTVLVVSADPAVRTDWARYFEALGMPTLRCVGPQGLCILVEGGDCPLHKEADLAIYDRAAVTPELALRLMRRGRSLPIAFAADRLDAHGHHEPVVSAVASDRREACVGASIDEVAR